MEKTLLCLPHAGGSTIIYHKWKKTFGNNIEILPLEYSGRGKRSGEQLFSNIDQIVEDLYNQVVQIIGSNNSYAVFGFSMGSLIGYELCLKLIDHGYKRPLHFFAAALEAPIHLEERKSIHSLSDEEFLREIKKYNGMPEFILKDPVSKKYFLSILRSDFKAIDDYKCKGRKLQTELTMLMGEKDVIPKEKIRGWKEIITGTSKEYSFNGDHFFLNDHYVEIKEIIKKTMLLKF